MSQLQEGTLAKAEAQKAAQEIRSLQKQADTEEKGNFAIQEEIEALKVEFCYILPFSVLALEVQIKPAFNSTFRSRVEIVPLM